MSAPTLTLAAVLFISAFASAVQDEPSRPAARKVRWHFIDQATVPDPAPDMPEHVRLLYADEVDLVQVERAFREHYEDRGYDAPYEDLEGNPYAKFFRQWYVGAQNYADDNGIVRALSSSALVDYRAATAQPIQAEERPRFSWSFVGPKRTVWRADHNAAQTAAPWQVNIYSIAVAASNPSILYCGSETGALYKTTDKGLNWEPLDNFNWGRAILSVAIDPTNPNVVFAATSTDIFRSTNAGNSWTIVQTQAGLSCNSLSIDPEDPSTILAGTAQGLLRSLDGGDTWTTPISQHIDDVVFHPSGGGVAYALARNSTNDTYTFYRSLNGGSSFSASMAGWGTYYEHSGGRITVTPANDQYVYVALLTHDGSGGNPNPVIQKSTDGAASWNVVAVGQTPQLGMNNGQGYYDFDIVASHANPNRVIVATTTAYRSDDGGVNWTAAGGYTGPFSIHPDIQEMISIMDGGTENTWISTDGGANFSTDFYSNTANWEARTDGLDGTDFWGFAQGWHDDYLVGGRYHNGNTALHENYPEAVALRLGGAESVTGWALHGRERFAAFDDIEELILPATIDSAPKGSFLFSKHPQNYYYGDAFSRVMVDLEDFMTVYLGQGNSFWRSNDGGGSWEAIHTFGGKPYHFDIARADGDYFYLAADDGFYRSTDRGETFTEMTLPSGLTDWHSQNLRVAASSLNRDEVWVLNHRSSATSGAGRVFRSINGGASWTDWTTAKLAGRKWRAIAHQAGTNGGIYVASLRGDAGTNPARVMYRDNTMTDWVDFSAGLPPSANPIKILPFYRDGKLRWGGNRGAWEIDFYEQNWTPIVQPFVSGKAQICVRNTVEFDSYSIARGDASYSWEIPGANWTSDLDARQVSATYPAPGSYTATLTLTQDGVDYTKSIQIDVNDECSPEVTPGNALSLGLGSNDYAATGEGLDLTTDRMTISAWIKRNGDQERFAGIVFMRGTTAAGLNFGTNNQLGFHWNNSEWWWDSGLGPPDGEWVHGAMVTAPVRTALYVNGVQAINTTDNNSITIDGIVAMGADPNFGARRFKGEIDEVAIYSRSMLKSEVRELMHRTRDPLADPTLVGYWQFNRASGTITDRVGTNHASLIGSATRVPSTAPVGAGASATQQVLGAGSYTFGSTGLTLEFPGSATSFPGGDVVVTRIDSTPDVAPTATPSSAYWVVRNFGSNALFDELTSLTFDGVNVSVANVANPGSISLYRRTTPAGATWGPPQDQADAATQGANGNVTFSSGNGQTSFGQYVLSLP